MCVLLKITPAKSFPYSVYLRNRKVVMIMEIFELMPNTDGDDRKSSVMKLQDKTSPNGYQLGGLLLSSSKKCLFF
jgi:hypothetical protein